jgi:hypothetical protein
VGLVIDRTQALLADVSVDLGGLQTGVAEQFLYDPEVGPPVQQMGGEAVTEGVGVGGQGRPVID